MHFVETDKHMTHIYENLLINGMWHWQAKLFLLRICEYLYNRPCCPGVEQHIQSLVVNEDSPSMQNKNLPPYRNICYINL
jgi:hypothetical protein